MTHSMRSLVRESSMGVAARGLDPLTHTKHGETHGPRFILLTTPDLIYRSPMYVTWHKTYRTALGFRKIPGASLCVPQIPRRELPVPSCVTRAPLSQRKIASNTFEKLESSRAQWLMGAESSRRTHLCYKVTATVWNLTSGWQKSLF